MLRVYHSNSLDSLRDLLVEMISQAPLQDPFCAEQILVQSPGMAQWLKLEVAQRINIAANIDFPLPASFLWRTFASLLTDVPDRSAYSKENMTWVLMRILPEKLTSPEFKALNHYLAKDQQPLKLFQLCEKIADLFDQYLVYRPDWIAQWESEENFPAEEEDIWQPILWRAIVEDTKNRGLPHWHRANMFSAFINAINEAAAEAIPQRVFVFGISALPENYLQALVALGKRCDIHLMVANPCRHFWSDIVDRRYLAKLTRTNYQSDQKEIAELSLYEQGNPLLASMGKLGRDYLYLLNQLDLPEVQLFSEDNNQHLLNAIQSDILSLRNRKTGQDAEQLRLAIEREDQSICIQNCYSAMREVEVLQDQLLAMLDETPDLEPRDIIVMMPDVAAYSPFIDAVFGQAPYQRYVPFSISDRNAQQESPLITNFLQLLSLPKSRYGTSEVLELFSLPALLRRFEIEESSFEKIRRWVIESGIKWGLDGEDRTALDIPHFEQNSWQFGIDRMFTGFAIGDMYHTWQNIAPYPEIEGLDAASLGQFSHFIDLLHFCKEQLNKDSNISGWLDFFHQLLSDLYQPDDRDLVALELIYSALEKLQSSIAETSFEDVIPAEIVIDHLQQNLSEQHASQRFLSGQVNFCTLMPMRAIPFKIVCLLGMNDGDYPRSIPPMGFDLMAEHSRKGDRSRRDDDRYLFLEALLSAKDRLYISFVGKSVADNSTRAPSVLVSELLEYIQQGYFLKNNESEGTINTNLRENDSLLETFDGELDFITVEKQSEEIKKQLIIEQPLTAYHRSNFSKESSLFSFADQWLSIADTEVLNVNSPSFLSTLPEENIKEVSLSSLISFFRQPIKYFFQHRLQVSFLNDEDLLEDEEPFALDGLDNYIQRNSLLTNSLQTDDQAYLSYLKHSGVLPVGEAGDKLLLKNNRDVLELAEKIRPLMEGTLRKLSFNLHLSRLQLKGWIDPLYDKGVIKYSVSNSSGRSFISTWIEHLAACANHCEHSTFFRAINAQFHFRPVAAQTALDILDGLIEIFISGSKKPLPWLPDVGWQLFNSDDEQKFKIDAEKNYNQFEDPYLQRAFPKWKDIATGLMAINDEIFQPLSEYLVIDSDPKAEGDNVGI